MTKCVFCQIIKGQLPCWKIYEDENFLAFLDIAPHSDGHTQVIPKKHYRWVWDYPEPGKYFKVAAKIVNHFRKVSGKDWVVGLIWGQDVPHAHIQILPWPENITPNWPREKLTEKKANKLIKKFALW
jgi:histidine triad (HIT) family protein